MGKVVCKNSKDELLTAAIRSDDYQKIKFLGAVKNKSVKDVVRFLLNEYLEKNPEVSSLLTKARKLGSS